MNIISKALEDQEVKKLIKVIRVSENLSVDQMADIMDISSGTLYRATAKNHGTLNLQNLEKKLKRHFPKYFDSPEPSEEENGHAPSGSEFIYENKDGQWEQNDRLKGALMIRPVFSKADSLVLNVVPEPSTYITWGVMGLVGTGLYWKRRKK